MAGPPVVVPAKGAHAATVIWLHGLGDSGSGWAPIAHELDMPHVKWVFPSAGDRPVTLNGGMRMPAWADILGLSLESPEDEEGTMATRNLIHSLIADEMKAGVAANRIVVGGFSQGAAMACVAALTHEQSLAGCFLLSGYLTLRNKISSLLTDGGRATPFFQAHGTQDMVVPFMFGQISSQLITSFGVKVDFKNYDMGHAQCAQEMADLKKFLSTVIPAAPPAPIPEDLASLSAKELKEILKSRAVDFSDCYEKGDLVNKIKALQ
eukprot:Tamp_20970.p1 GENE.Tamp_20970~~Tamp_20970.p1  ORF type:complete len:306 (+),score=80.90 Tamp_20970:125-919(+)